MRRLVIFFPLAFFLLSLFSFRANRKNQVLKQKASQIDSIHAVVHPEEAVMEPETMSGDLSEFGDLEMGELEKG